MWEAISTTLTSGNAIPVLVFAALVVVVFVVMVKKGKLSINKGGVKIGGDEALLRAELDLGKSMVSVIPVDRNDYQQLYIRQELNDLIQDWIVLNNMSMQEYYLKSKTLQVQAIDGIDLILEDPRTFTEDVVTNLVELKKSWK